MLIAAVSDVHSPIYLSQFSSSIGLRISEAKLFLFAGDMIYKGNYRSLEKVLKVIRKFYSGQIVSVFGNEEHDNIKEILKERYKEVIWLDDESKIFSLEGKKIKIVGTRGSLQEPTTWQKQNIKNIEQIYRERTEKIKELLMKKEEADITILLSHYATCKETIFGEDEKAYPYLMDPKMEEVILYTRPNIVIHGHAHNATKLYFKINETVVYNVAFPARKAITMIEV